MTGQPYGHFPWGWQAQNKVIGSWWVRQSLGHGQPGFPDLPAPDAFLALVSQCTLPSSLCPAYLTLFFLCEIQQCREYSDLKENVKYVLKLEGGSSLCPESPLPIISAPKVWRPAPTGHLPLSQWLWHPEFCLPGIPSILRLPIGHRFFLIDRQCIYIVHKIFSLYQTHSYLWNLNTADGLFFNLLWPFGETQDIIISLFPQLPRTNLFYFFEADIRPTKELI